MNSQPKSKINLIYCIYLRRYPEEMIEVRLMDGTSEYSLRKLLNLPLMCTRLGLPKPDDLPQELNYSFNI